MDGKVASGAYSTASEVVRAALRLLTEQDRRQDPQDGTSPVRSHAR